MYLSHPTCSKALYWAEEEEEGERRGHRHNAHPSYHLLVGVGLWERGTSGRLDGDPGSLVLHGSGARGRACGGLKKEPRSGAELQGIIVLAG